MDKLIKCSDCERMLGKVSGAYEVQCPKCKTINKGHTSDMLPNYDTK